MKRQTPHTESASVATCTGSTPKKLSMKAQSLALRESLTSGTHNPFQRVDGELLQMLERVRRKESNHDFEDALL